MNIIVLLPVILILKVESLRHDVDFCVFLLLMGHLAAAE